jgi:LPXTG-motif cell wall-anchored protein
MVIATLALVAGALLLAPIGATQGTVPTLSPTPPVALAPPPTTTTAVTQHLPKTGFEAWLLALMGLALVVAGSALRSRGGPALRRRALAVVGVGLVVAGEVVRPQARPVRASRRTASRGTATRRAASRRTR